MNFEQLAQAMKLREEFEENLKLLAYNEGQIAHHKKMCVEHQQTINMIAAELQELGVEVPREIN
jgi:ferritin-like protein